LSDVTTVDDCPSSLALVVTATVDAFVDWPTSDVDAADELTALLLDIMRRAPELSPRVSTPVAAHE
jgi:hypothetical protein